MTMYSFIPHIWEEAGRSLRSMLRLVYLTHTRQRQGRGREEWKRREKIM